MRVSLTGRPLIQRAIDRAAAARPIPGNRVELLQDGPAAFGAMLGIIESARRFIHFENYIIRDDATGQRFATALMERARAGVAVRVLYDWLGSIGTSRRYWRALRDAGCEVRVFNPPTLLRPFRVISRDHRKLVVSEAGRAVVGGLCIGDEWAGDPDRGIPPWRDTAVLIEGPASTALDLAFGRVWALAGPPLDPAENAPDVPSAGDAMIRIVVGEPGRQRIYRVIEYLTAGARRRIWLVDAYLLPPPRLFEVMSLAEGDGVDIRILVPGASDVPTMRNLTRVGYRDMLRAGIRIFEWQGPMIHAKTIVADSRWTRVGTSNLNASSLIGNYELDIVIEDPTLARLMEQQFRRDMAGSAEVVRLPRRGPHALQRVMPARLERQAPPTAVTPRRGARERRTRTVLAVRRLASGALRSLFGPTSVVLVVLAALFLLFPRILGYIFGVLCLAFAVAAGLQAWWRRDAGERGTDRPTGRTSPYHRSSASRPCSAPSRDSSATAASTSSRTCGQFPVAAAARARVSRASASIRVLPCSIARCTARSSTSRASARSPNASRAAPTSRRASASPMASGIAAYSAAPSRAPASATTGSPRRSDSSARPTCAMARRRLLPASRAHSMARRSCLSASSSAPFSLSESAMLWLVSPRPVT